jgi:hypothetical protein
VEQVVGLIVYSLCNNIVMELGHVKLKVWNKTQDEGRRKERKEGTKREHLL